VAVVCEDYPGAQISRDNFVNIQRAIGRLVDELPEEGFTPRLVDTYWAKGAAIMVCQDSDTKDWLEKQVPSMAAWEGSSLKVVSMDALSTYKRVVAWFPGPAEDTERLFLRLRRLNRGLDTRNWRVYKRKEELESALCSVLTQNPPPYWKGCDGDPSVAWGRLSSPC
jgi:hypothetical protein